MSIAPRHWLRFVHLTWFKIQHFQSGQLVIAGLTAAFAVAFAVVGIQRKVEFEGVGLSPRRKRILLSVHVSGCLFLSLALLLFAVDFDRSLTPLVTDIFALSLTLLLPVHFYLFRLRKRLRAK